MSYTIDNQIERYVMSREDAERVKATAHDIVMRDAAAQILALMDERNAAVSAAVQAEREACAVLAGQAVMRVKTSTQQAHDMTLAEFRSVCSCAAEDAIRARNEVTK